MQNKYKNITIPYKTFNKNDNYTYYIYKDKEYTKLNELMKDFIDFELTYHFEANGTLKTVHNFNDVIESLLVNYKNFYISRKYKEEYSDSEYEYITRLKQALLKDKLKLSYKPRFEQTFKFYEKKHKEAYEEIYEKYKKIIVPKKVKSTIYNRKYYVVAGIMYESVIHALDEVFNYSLYYEYGGSPRGGSNASFHEHDFETIIYSIISNFDKFKIYSYQRELYSNQELYLMDTMMKKLKKMKYKPVSNRYDEEYMHEYNYLVNNRKYIRLFFFNMKDSLEERRRKRKDLENHKLKEE